MDATSLKVVESYTMRWGNGKEDVVVWRILKDGATLSFKEATLVVPEKIEYNKELWEDRESELDDPSEFFFKFIFPDITGK
jgi:hypothetical protein